MLGALFAALAAREALAEKPRPAVVGSWLACAVLGHVGHLMALPALAWLLTRKIGRKSLLPCAATLAAVVLAAYAAAGLFAVRPHSLDELRAVAVGQRRSRRGSRVLLALGELGRRRSVVGADDACGFSAISTAASASPSGGGTRPRGSAARRGRPRRRARRPRGPVLAFLAGRLRGAVPELGAVDTIVYRVSDLLGLWTLALFGLQGLSARARAGLLASWTAAAAAYNLAFVVRPAADPASNADLVETRWVAPSTRRATLG